jgi:methanogenic corrinoid protein MtbC1
MEETLSKLSKCIELGKVNKLSSFPQSLVGQDGAYELTKEALDKGIKPEMILDNALIPAMTLVGNKFGRNEIFVPELLMAAKAMTAAMKHIKPYFLSGETKTKGKFIIGTVAGDLHDIGKTLVATMMEGGGWEVIDLGVDVTTDKFLKAISENTDAAVGLSALLTTTMENMKKTVSVIREKYSGIKIIVGGAPVTMEYCKQIGADFYSPDPQGAVNYLNQFSS